jgi:hypothetical protein
MAKNVNAAIAAAQEFVEARRAAEAAEEAKKEASKKLLAAFEAADLDNVEINGIKVAAVNTSRRAVNIAKFRELVTPAKFKKVTKTVVDLKLLDAAIATQILDAAAIAEAVTTTEVTQVRVYGDAVATAA